MVVPGSVGSYRPVIAGAKLREGTTTILPLRGRALQGVGLSSMRFHPIGGGGKTMDESDSDDAGAVSAHKTSMFGLLGINRLSLGPFAEFHFYTGKRWRPVGPRLL